MAHEKDEQDEQQDDDHRGDGGDDARGNLAAYDLLHDLDHDFPAVKRRQGHEVHDAKRHRDDRDDVEQRDHGGLGGLFGHGRDAHHRAGLTQGLACRGRVEQARIRADRQDEVVPRGLQRLAGRHLLLRNACQHPKLRLALAGIAHSHARLVLLAVALVGQRDLLACRQPRQNLGEV